MPYNYGPLKCEKVREILSVHFAIQIPMRILQKAGLPLKRMKLGGYGELTQTVSDLKTARMPATSGPVNLAANASTLPRTSHDLNLDLSLSLARKVVLVIEPESDSSGGERPGKRRTP